MADKAAKFNGGVYSERGNLVEDIQTKDYSIVSVRHEDLRSKFTEENGWKVLRYPEKGKKYGLVYRQRVDTIQSGMGINESSTKYGIPVNGSREAPEYTNVEDNHFIIREDRHYLRLTEKELETLEFENDPIKMLVKSYAHKDLLLETQIFRDYVIDSMLTDLSKKSNDEVKTEFKTMVKDRKEDPEKELPVFLNLGDLTLQEAVHKGIIPARIAGEYEPVDKKLLSDIGGFKNKLQYVKKDTSYYIQGYKDQNLGDNNYKTNKLAGHLKDVIRWLKINTIIVNPAKITMDFVSTNTLVMAKGTSIQEVIKYNTEAIKLNKEMTNLRNRKIMLEVEAAMYNGGDEHVKKKFEAKIDKLNDQINKHPFSVAMSNGFLNSIATDMVPTERDAIGGLNHKMEQLLQKLTVNGETKEYTKFNNTIKNLANKGVNIEVIYTAMANGVGKFENMKNVEDMLRTVADDMSKAKSKEDMTNYLEQFVLSPNSHIVRLGSAATLYSDLLPKWALYRHNINSGMSEQEAAIETLNTTLDYKMNMPPSMKFLSDLYIMPFPTFFVRIQRVLLSLMYKNPASFTLNIAGIELANAAGFNTTFTILNSNIFNKWEKDSIFTSFFDIARGTNFIPFSNAMPTF
jgi:hypothetical protein